jgi:Curli production assembly/transport component CsgF.
MHLLWIYLGLLSLFSAPAAATELVHHFESPSFGGNPLNGTVLLNQATAQNKLKDSTTVAAYTPATPQSAIDRFKSSLQSAILNQVSRSSTLNLFDSNGNIKLGSILNFDLNGDGSNTFSVQVSAEPVNGNISINISDGITDTVLTVPYVPITPKP